MTLSRAQTISRYGWIAVLGETSPSRIAKLKDDEKARYAKEREEPGFIRRLRRRGVLRHLPSPD